MTAPPDLVRLSKRIDQNKGIQLSPEDLALIVQSGAYDAVVNHATKYQREQCQARDLKSRSISGENTRLFERPGRNHEIVWYDAAAGRERSRSSRSRDVQVAKDALDRLYLQRERGQAVCSMCGRPWEDNRRFLLVQSMIDYDTAPKITLIL